MVAQEVADRIVTSEGKILIAPMLKDVVEERSKFLQLDRPPFVYVIDPEGNVLSNKDSFRHPPHDQVQQIPILFL